MKTKEKFDDLDRRRVKETTEKHFRVKLKKVKKSEKWLRDNSGTNWILMGGVGNFHGMAKEIVDNEREAESEGKLIIALKKTQKIELFTGSLKPIVQAANSGNLRDPRGKRDYKLNMRIKGKHMVCTKDARIVLEYFSTIQHSQKDREMEAIKLEIEKSTPAERKEILKIIDKKLENNTT